jgi:hypothetical protein
MGSVQVLSKLTLILVFDGHTMGIVDRVFDVIERIA